MPVIFTGPRPNRSWNLTMTAKYLQLQQNEQFLSRPKMRHFWTKSISCFQANAVRTGCLRFGQSPIIIFYVNYLSYFRFRSGPVRGDYKDYFFGGCIENQSSNRPHGLHFFTISIFVQAVAWTIRKIGWAFRVMPDGPKIKGRAYRFTKGAEENDFQKWKTGDHGTPPPTFDCVCGIFQFFELMFTGFIMKRGAGDTGAVSINKRLLKCGSLITLKGIRWKIT